eukprot:g45901.t1
MVEGTPLSTSELEMAKSVKFPDVMITNNLSSSSDIDVTVKKAQQHPYFLRRLRKFRKSIKNLTNFYSCTIESILSGCIVAWYGNCSAQDHKKLLRVVYTTQSIMQAKLPSIDSIYTSHCLGKAANITKGPSHPGYNLFPP